MHTVLCNSGMMHLVHMTFAVRSIYEERFICGRCVVHSAPESPYYNDEKKKNIMPKTPSMDDLTMKHSKGCSLSR